METPDHVQMLPLGNLDGMELDPKLRVGRFISAGNRGQGATASRSLSRPAMNSRCGIASAPSITSIADVSEVANRAGANTQV